MTCRILHHALERRHPILSYILGFLTPLAIAWVVGGSIPAIDAVRHLRPSQTLCTMPPHGLNVRWWFFWPLVLLSPVIWPISVLLFQLDEKKRHERWNAMTIRERSAEIDRWRARDKAVAA